MKFAMKMNTKTLLLTTCCLLMALLYACGDDEGTSIPITERVKGTWIQTSFQMDCPEVPGEDSRDELVDLLCDEDNCRRIILGDSTFATVNTVNGVTSRIDEFYLFMTDFNGEIQGSEIEICDGVDFRRNCFRTFEVSQSGDVLTLIRRSADEECVDSFVYTREAAAPDGGG